MVGKRGGEGEACIVHTISWAQAVVGAAVSKGVPPRARMGSRDQEEGEGGRGGIEIDS